MPRMTVADLKMLQEHRAPWTVSIWMPTWRGGPQTRENPIRFKTLVNRSLHEMESLGRRWSDARQDLGEALALEDEAPFWREQEEGLAMFLGAHRPVLVTLPYPVEELVTVSDCFHLVPLFPLVNDHNRFHVLALSQKSVRYYDASRHDIQEVRVENVPRSIDELTRFVDSERQLQWHTHTPGRGPRADRAAVFHGQGVGSDERKRERRLAEYCHAVAAGLHDRLQAEGAPLVLAAAEPMASLYREANDYPGLCEETIEGNPDRVPAEELLRRAVDLLARKFDEDERRDADQYRQLAAHGQGSTDLEEVLQAAHMDRIDRLFVARGTHRWGPYDPQGGGAQVHEKREPGDGDLVNLAAVRAARGGAKVHAVDPARMPAQAPVAATFRFPNAG